MNSELFKLKNKLNTLFIDAPGSNMASIQIWFRAGSSFESSGDEGIAHFLEHMFFKGTNKRPGSKIAGEIEALGGEINAFTSFDYTCYYINTPNDHMTKAIDIVLDMVSNPKFLQKDLLPEREVVFEEYKRSLDNPNQYNFFELQKSCFKGSYGHPILGHPQTIKNFTRTQLKNFRKKYYNLSNTMFLVAGDFKNHDNKIKKLIEKYRLPEGPTSKAQEFKLKNKNTAKVHKKDVNQIALTLCIEAPPLDSRTAIAEDLAINCLGSGETSKFYQDLVIKNTKASAVSGSTMFFSKGGSHFVKIVCPIENINDIYEEFFKILEQSLKTGINEQELQKIKNQYLANKVYEKESLESYAFSLGYSFAQTNDIYFEEKFLESVKACPLDDVNKALKDIFTRPTHFSLQIPEGLDSKEHQKSLMTFQEKFKKFSPQSDNKKKKQDSLAPRLKKSSYDPSLTQCEYKKGITLIHRYNELAPTFSLQVYIKGGLSKESTENNGAHNLMAGLLTKGFGKTSYEKIKKDLEFKSASLNGFSGKNSYGLSTHAQTIHAKDIFNYFFGSLLKPNLPSKFISHEKQLTHRSLINEEKDPVRICFQNFSKIIFPEHPYSLNILGSKSSLKKLTKNKLKDLHDLNIKNNELVFSFCGNIPFAEFYQLVDSYLKNLPPRNKKGVDRRKQQSMKGKNIFIPLDREQSQILIGRSGPQYGGQEELYLKLLSTHLSGQSSELFVDVRDRKGLCYVAQPIHFVGIDGGSFGIYMASGYEKTPMAIDAIKHLLKKYSTKGLTRSMFNRAKNMIKGQCQINIQTNEDYTNLYGIPTLYGLGPDHHYKSLKNIDNLNFNKFHDYIMNFLDYDFNTIVVGRE